MSTTAKTTANEPKQGVSNTPKGAPPKPVSNISPLITKLAQKVLIGTFTVNQLRKRMRLLKDYLNFKLFQDDKKMDFLESVGAFLQKYPLYQIEGHWISSLGEDFIKQFNDTNSSSLLISLNHYFESLNTPILILPFPLSDDIIYQKNINLEQDKAGKTIPTQLIVEIGTWFKKNVSELFIFQSDYNPDLIGGCALSINGVYRDFSLRVRINENKEAIIKMLKETRK